MSLVNAETSSSTTYRWCPRVDNGSLFPGMVVHAAFPETLERRNVRSPVPELSRQRCQDLPFVCVRRHANGRFQLCSPWRVAEYRPAPRLPSFFAFPPPVAESTTWSTAADSTVVLCRVRF